MERPSKTTKTFTRARDEEVEPTFFPIFSESEGEEVTEQKLDIRSPPSLMTVKKEKVESETANRVDMESNRSSGSSSSRQQVNNDSNCSNSKTSRKRKRGHTSTAEVLERVEPRLLLEQYVTERQNNTVLLLQTRVSQLKKELQEKEKLFQEAEKVNLETLRLAESHHKGQLLTEITAVLESEFNCCICNEVFIEPAVISCGHSFCSYCINRALQQDYSCPVCRTGYNFSQPAKNVEMRNFITKLYSFMPEEVRTTRDQVVQERNALPPVESQARSYANQFRDRLLHARRRAERTRTAAETPTDQESINMDYDPFEREIDDWDHEWDDSESIGSPEDNDNGTEWDTEVDRWSSVDDSDVDDMLSDANLIGRSSSTIAVAEYPRDSSAVVVARYPRESSAVAVADGTDHRRSNRNADSRSARAIASTSNPNTSVVISDASAAIRNASAAISDAAVVISNSSRSNSSRSRREASTSSRGRRSSPEPGSASHSHIEGSRSTSGNTLALSENQNRSSSLTSLRRSQAQESLIRLARSARERQEERRRFYHQGFPSLGGESRSNRPDNNEGLRLRVRHHANTSSPSSSRSLSRGRSNRRNTDTNNSDSNGRFRASPSNNATFFQMDSSAIPIWPSDSD